MKKLFIFLGLCIAGMTAYYVSSKQQKVDYSTQIKPILNKNCISCHGGVKKQGGFSLLFQEEALGKTESGKPAIIPGHPEQSSFIQRLHSKDPEEKMPYQRPALSEEEIELLTTWVKEGANWGEHWAYQPLEAPSIPTGSWLERLFLSSAFQPLGPKTTSTISFKRNKKTKDLRIRIRLKKPICSVGYI